MEKQAMKGTAVARCKIVRVDFNHMSYPPTPWQEAPSMTSCRGDSQISTRSFFMVSVVAFNDSRYEKHAPLFYGHGVNLINLFFV
jgi:hypothetical protein